MNTLLLDANVWLAAADARDPHHEACKRLLTLAGEGHFNPAVLDLTLYEVANVAIVRWRDQLAASQLASNVELACVGRIVHADSDLISAATSIAAAKGITVYDAAYVAASQACQWPLVSCDMRDLVSNGLAVLPSDALN